MNRLDVTAPHTAQGKADTGPLLYAMEKMALFTEAEGDTDQSGKFRELAAKLARGMLTVAFCGHFSAGKSTLVNAICGVELLPSSPIPTSANVVTIKNGEPSAVMSFRDKHGRITEERPIPVEELHRFAVDGEGVASIEVSYPVPLLGGDMAIVDTPGVDSTDSAHRAATESALHLADVVFYVTDYNHVLSDVNFRFLRGLAEWGKPAYVIVNQIDKHRTEEVSFESFREGLWLAMEEWKIHPAGVLFLSLRHPEHPLSQWKDLLTVLQSLPPLRSRLTVRSAERSARYLADQFEETLRTRHRAERERLQEKLGDSGEDEPERLAALRQQSTNELDSVRHAASKRRETLREELDRLLAGANLTPAETRDKAADVLESMQTGFKTGWFAGVSKTEAERERRFALLADDLNRQIAAQMNGHIRELLRRAAKEAGWDGEPMESALETLFEPVSPQWLRDRVKPGVGADGQATLYYAAELSADVKAIYRKQSLKWNDRVEGLRSAETGAEEKRIMNELLELQQRAEAAEALAALEEAERRPKERLLAMLPDDDAAADLRLPIPGSVSAEPAVVVSEADTKIMTGRQAAEPGRTTAMDEPDLPLGAPGGAAELLKQAAELLSEVPALARTAEGLAAKAARLRDRRFTIALFGAFSAGKSSFANALVGLPVLPVSPNPTTAAINRIVLPTPDVPHGTASVTMKSRQAMKEDIRHSLRRIGVSRNDMESAGDDAATLLGLAAGMPPEEVHPRGKPHLAFLRAAAAGWEHYAALLDKTFTAAGAEYRKYAADEQASCFVAEIDLSIDSPLTRGGAVLVDTPGADSINARHTGVAFEYIKNADAVLFITYYNHAFTEADRQFLNQLGSVKDVFELDKMFFMINAADLASSEQELQAVKDHVEGQLLKHGIRRPRLFGVSSLNALHAKQTGDRNQLASSGLAEFEMAFRTFAESELGSLAAASARKELERAGKQLQGWLQTATAETATREAAAENWLGRARWWREQAGSDMPAAAVQPLLQETAEQLYHLRQRVYYRFGEHFQSAFHPSVLQDDGRDLKKLLAACWDDLKRGVGEDLLQELRTAGLRLEVALQRTVGESLVSVASELAAEGFVADAYNSPSPELPMDEPFAEGPEMESKRLWQAFKSPKQFFENEGAKTLRDELSELLFRRADEWLSVVQERWKDAVAAAYRSSIREAYGELADAMAAYAHNLGQSMQKPEERHMLEQLSERWQNLMQSHLSW